MQLKNTLKLKNIEQLQLIDLGRGRFDRIKSESRYSMILSKSMLQVSKQYAGNERNYQREKEKC